MVGLKGLGTVASLLFVAVLVAGCLSGDDDNGDGDGQGAKRQGREQPAALAEAAAGAQPRRYE